MTATIADTDSHPGIDRCKICGVLRLRWDLAIDTDLMISSTTLGTLYCRDKPECRAKMLLRKQSI